MVRRSGAPWWSFATRTSVRCPTTSRPSRIQPRRRSSRRRPAPSSSAARSGAGIPSGSRTSRSAPARRANATSRASWSARPGERGPSRTGAARGTGATGVDATGRADVASGGAAGTGRPARAVPRSSTRMSTARAWSSVPAIASAWAGPSGTSTASHSRLTPRATASTGSSARGRSTQAASAPPACASARTRSASVVAPLEPAPASATVPARGRPPAARSASSSGKPVGIARSVAVVIGRERGVTGTGLSARRGAIASAPNTSVAGRGAAAPQRSRREARAAARSGLRSIGRPRIEHLFDVVKGHAARAPPSLTCHAGPAGRPPTPGAVLHSRPAIAPACVRSAARGDVAQPEEHRVRIAGVRGSSPLISTICLASRQERRMSSRHALSRSDTWCFRDRRDAADQPRRTRVGWIRIGTLKSSAVWVKSRPQCACGSPYFAR